MRTIDRSRAGALDAIELIRADHRTLKSLFRRFEAADTHEEKKEIARTAIEAIDLHALIEEEAFYPALRRAIGDEEMLVEAREAHHAVKLLLAELKLMPAGARYSAKFALVCESLRRHIEDEENELLPVASRTGLDLARLGGEMSALRESVVGRVVARAGGRTGVAAVVGGAALIAGIVALVVTALRGGDAGRSG